MLIYKHVTCTCLHANNMLYMLIKQIPRHFHLLLAWNSLLAHYSSNCKHLPLVQRWSVLKCVKVSKNRLNYIVFIMS